MGEGRQGGADRSSLPAGGVREFDHVGHYEIRRLLGRGASGSVWEAWDTRLQRAVAIKRLDGTHGLPEAWGMREARLTARMRHPAFVAVHEVLHDGGVTFLVMEMISGRTLSQILARGERVPEAACRAWLLEAADALQVAHAREVVHGDIKPSNLMIDEHHHLRVLDLGVARPFDAEATLDRPWDGSPAGTLAYMAPELLLNARPSVASDLYALGLTFHELASGLPGPRTRADFAFAQERLNEHRTLPRGAIVDEELFALLDRMARRDPAQRPAGMGEVVEWLQRGVVRAAADGLLQAASLALPPASMPPPTPMAMPAPTPFRWPRALVIAAVGVAAALIIAFVGLHRWPHGDIAGPSSVELAVAERSLRLPDDDAGIARAITTFEAALRVEPGQARTAAALAIAYCIRYAGNERDPAWLARADASAQLALAGESQLSIAHAARAWVLELQDQDASAQAEYERALTLDPRDFHALNGQAQLLLKQDQAVAALAVFREALKAYPDEPTFLNGLGTAYFRHAELDAAAQAFSRCIAVRPRGVIAYANLNAVLTRQGRLPEALSVLQQGLALRPDARLYGNLGTTLFALGRYVDAAAAFDQALSAERGSPNDYRNWANFGDALRMIPGREAASAQAYRRALELQRPRLAGGADATLLSRAGLYASRVGDKAAAHAWTAAALARAPDDADVLFRATIVAVLSHDRDAALERLARAVALGYPRHLVEREPDLQGLRRDRRFHELMTKENSP